MVCATNRRPPSLVRHRSTRTPGTVGHARRSPSPFTCQAPRPCIQNLWTPTMRPSRFLVSAHAEQVAICKRSRKATTIGASRRDAAAGTASPVTRWSVAQATHFAHGTTPVTCSARRPSRTSPQIRTVSAPAGATLAVRAPKTSTVAAPRETTIRIFGRDRRSEALFFKPRAATTIDGDRSPPRPARAMFPCRGRGRTETAWRGHSPGSLARTGSRIPSRLQPARSRSRSSRRSRSGEPDLAPIEPSRNDAREHRHRLFERDAIDGRLPQNCSIFGIRARAASRSASLPFA